MQFKCVKDRKCYTEREREIEREREREREKHEPKVGPPADFRIFFYLSKHLFAISLSVRSVVCSKGRIINPLPRKMFDDKFELVYDRWGQLCKPFLSYFMRTSKRDFRQT